MTAVQTVQRFEYEQATEITRVRWLAEQGWRLHSAVPCGGNIVYLMERPMAAGAVVDRLRDAEAERDRLVQALAEEQRQSAYYRDKADGLAPVDAEWDHARAAHEAAERALAAVPYVAVPQPVRDAVDALGGLLAIWDGCGEDA